MLLESPLNKLDNCLKRLNNNLKIGVIIAKTSQNYFLIKQLENCIM